MVSDIGVFVILSDFRKSIGSAGFCHARDLSAVTRVSDNPQLPAVHFIPETSRHLSNQECPTLTCELALRPFWRQSATSISHTDAAIQRRDRYYSPTARS
jgi:hypothetical protein